MGNYLHQLLEEYKETEDAEKSEAGTPLDTEETKEL